METIHTPGEREDVLRVHPLHEGAPRHRTISLLDVQPRLADDIPDADVQRARRGLAVREAALLHGLWRPGPPAEGPRRGVPVLGRRGATAGDTVLQDRAMAELLAPGDVLPARTAASDVLPAPVPYAVEVPGDVPIV